MDISSYKNYLDQGATLIFNHIGKTGGTTLHSIIERQFQHNEIFFIKSTAVKQSINQFKCLPDEDKLAFRCIKGHGAFGLHNYLPQPYIYITMLREPLDRVISLYYYIVRFPYHPVHKEVTSKNMSLPDCLANNIWPGLKNEQTSSISGYSQNDVTLHPVEALEAAKRNLKEHFPIFGLAERFDESLILFKRALGWRNIFYYRQNTTKNRPSVEDIPTEILDLIKKHNKLDIELYRFSKEVFEELIDKQDSSFEKELQTFKRLNRVRGPVGEGRRLLRAGIRRIKTVAKINI